MTISDDLDAQRRKVGAAPTIAFVADVRCALGESPLWEGDGQRLFLVDARAPSIIQVDPASGRTQVWAAPSTVGSIAFSAGGGLIVGMAPGLHHLDLYTGAFTPLVDAGLAETERMNDGKTDRAGRYVTGTLTAHGVEPPIGHLFRFDEARPPAILETGIGVANAISFSPAGDRLYFADSLQRQVWRYAYDTMTGAVGPRELFVDTQPFDSAPDGATVDSGGRLWVALVHAQQIGCFSPEGRLERLIDTPAPYPSCPAFGGPELDVLYVTSIADSGGRLVSDHPDAGRLMAISGLGVTGLAETPCRLGPAPAPSHP